MNIINKETTFEEVKALSMITTDIEDVNIIHVGALFLGAKESGNKALEEKCRDRLQNDSQTKSAVKYVVNRLYGKYGVDELMYLYQQYSYDDIYNMIFPQVYDLWDELTWKYVSAYLNSDRKKIEEHSYFINHFLQLRVNGLYCQQICLLAKEKYPKLNYSGLRHYVKARKATGYVFSYSKYTNKQLAKMLEVAGIKPYTEESFNRYRVMFGYEAEEIIETRPLKEQPKWRATHRNELNFWKTTGADTINQKDQDDFIDYLRIEFDYAPEELADLTNWLMIARYEGRAADDIPVCNALKTRYEGEKIQRAIKQMRLEILMNIDVKKISPVFVKTLSGGFGGRTKGQINARFA